MLQATTFEVISYQIYFNYGVLNVVLQHTSKIVLVLFSERIPLRQGEAPSTR